MEVELVCAYCGEVFFKEKRLIKKSKSGLRFCNKECRQKAFKSGIVQTGPPPTGQVDPHTGKRQSKRKGWFCQNCLGSIYTDKGLCKKCREAKQISDWLSGDISVTWTGKLKDPKKFVKKELVRQRGDRCERCGFSEKHSDGLSIIQMNHVDGVWTNNSIDNLELLCPNCHALTENYGSRNRGKGRTGRAVYRH